MIDYTGAELAAYEAGKRAGYAAASTAISFDTSCLGCASRLADEAAIRADEARRLAEAGRLRPEPAQDLSTGSPA